MMKNSIQSGVEYLRQIQEADARVKKLEARVRNLRALATDNTYHMDEPIRHVLRDYDRTGTLMAEICDAEQELAEARNAAAEIRAEAGWTICRIEDPDAQDVIFMRYVKGMKCEEIAAGKMFSIQRVYQLRRKGITEVERIIGCGGNH